MACDTQRPPPRILLGIEEVAVCAVHRLVVGREAEGVCRWRFAPLQVY